MNGATAWNPASARAGSRSSQVWAVSGNPCRHSASGPEPASSSPNSTLLARTVAVRTFAGAAMNDTLPAGGARGDLAGWALSLAALAQELAELFDRLVLVGSKVLGDNHLRVCPVGPGVLAAVRRQYQERVMRDLYVVVHFVPRDAVGHQADRRRLAVVVLQVVEHLPSLQVRGFSGGGRLTRCTLQPGSHADGLCR